MTGRLTKMPASAATLTRMKKASVGAVKMTCPTGRMSTASTRSTKRNEMTVPAAKANSEMRRRRRSSSRCSISVIGRSSTEDSFRSTAFKTHRRLDAAEATPTLRQAPALAPLLGIGFLDLVLRVSHRASDLADGLTQRPADTGQSGGTEDQQCDHEDDHQLRPANVRHAPTSVPDYTAGRRHLLSRPRIL